MLFQLLLVVVGVLVSDPDHDAKNKADGGSDKVRTAGSMQRICLCAVACAVDLDEIRDSNRAHVLLFLSSLDSET